MANLLSDSFRIYLRKEANHMNKDKIILTALILGTFMTALDVTIVSVALPAISKAFYNDVTTIDVSWILLAYTLALCCFILLWAKLGTNIGYRKVFIIGTIIFVITSAAIGVAGFVDLGDNGLLIVILLRAIQGIGAGMVMSMSLAMVSTYLPEETRGSSIAAVSLAAAVGTAFGPVLGGLLTAIHWSCIFLINIPIGIGCLVLTIMFMDSSKEVLPEVKKRIDVLAAILACIMMFLLIYYIDQGSYLDGGYVGTIGLIMLIGIFLSAGLLIWWEQRAEDPLLSLRLLKSRQVMTANILNTLLFFIMAGCYLLLPIFLQNVYLAQPEFGFSEEQKQIFSGLILVANSVGLIVASPIVGKITDRTHDNKIFVVVGFLIAAVGLFMMFFFKERIVGDKLIFILASLVIMGFGLGMVIVAATNHAYTFAKPEESGQLSGMINMFREGGSSIGIAVLNAIFTTWFVNWGDSGYQAFISGFAHAIFIAAVVAMIGFVVSVTLKNKKDMDDCAN